MSINTNHIGDELYIIVTDYGLVALDIGNVGYEKSELMF